MPDTIGLTIRRERLYDLAFEPFTEDGINGWRVEGKHIVEALEKFFPDEDADNDLAAEVVRLTAMVGELSTKVADSHDQNQKLIQSVVNLSTLLNAPKGY